MDKFTITILPDGLVRVETDEIGEQNHMSADEFMSFLATELGGEVNKQSKPQSIAHEHTHLHQNG